MQVHIEGMGILGSLLAWKLNMMGITFTWHDAYLTDNPPGTQAWRASTGLIYPSGDAFDQQQYSRWAAWFRGEDAPWNSPRNDWLEKGAYWFSSKHPPHQGKYAIITDLGCLRQGALPSYHLNAQEFVEQTRARFGAGLRMGRPTTAGSIVVRAHGFTERMRHTIWGWSAEVRLEIDQQMLEASDGLRPMLYLRKGRFIVAYANPVPGTPWWYAGTSLITQRPDKARMLEIGPKLTTWMRHLQETCGTLIRPTAIGLEMQGWRPVSLTPDAPLVSRTMNTITMKPLWSSGIRHAPAVLDAVMGELHAIV